MCHPAPADNGGSAITDYVVQFSSNGGSLWNTFADGTSTATSATVTGLTDGIAYVFRVAAVNAVGPGAYTAASSSVTPVGASLTVSPSSGTAYNGTVYSWSGSGTAASPLETSDAAAPNGISWGDGNGGSTYRVWQFTCGVSGTLTVEFGGRENDGPEIPNMVRYVRNGTVSTTFTSSQTFFGTHGARRTLSVSAGDVIKFSLATGESTNRSTDWSQDNLYMKGKFRLWIS
ncbi:MAG: fibronectin type III domain-containing protein [Caulobacteraceae bacterium]|nr:fibronectin type III domain-containing protein [Caulobacteraceae bacterium]